MNFKLLPLLLLTFLSVNLFAAPSPAVTYGVLNTNDFRVTNSIVSLRGSSPNGSNIIYNLYTSNFFVTNITVQTITVESNLFTTNINVFNTYTTNLYVTYEVVSNIVAGNINGTVPHLSMFYPDGFSLTDSIVTQNTNDNNGITVNGTGDGYIVLSDGGAGIPYVDFGDNGTNRLYRSGSQLIYTNTAITGNGVTFVIINGAGVQTQVGVDQDSQSVIRADTGHVVKIEPNAGTQVYYATSGAFYPSDFLTLGLAERPWGPFYLGGFNDHATTTNFARLEVYHGGTNDFIHYNSRSSGTAGTNAPGHSFENNGARIGYFDKNSGYSGGGTLFLSDDGTYKSAGGGGGTINPTNLRIPIRQSSTNFADSALSQSAVGSTNVVVDGGIYFGVGRTNYLYVDPADNKLSYKSPDAVGYSIANFVNSGNSRSVIVGLSPYGAILSATGTGANQVDIGWNTGNVSMDNTAIYPPADNSWSVGSFADRVKNVWIGTTAYWLGYQDLVNQTNYAQLAITHAGTNDSIYVDSQSRGTAGPPRPIQFQFGGTNNFRLTPERPVVIPSLTKADKTAIASPVNGMVVYQTDITPGLRAYINGAWVILQTAADP